MRLFISHAFADTPVAQVLRVRLEEISEELDCSLLADDVFGGDLWEDKIRTAARDCDGILSVVTSRYIERPWFVAEWALFWYQDKPWYLLVDDVQVENLFEPMRRRQVSSLGDRRSVERFLRALDVKFRGRHPLDVVAAELIKAVEQTRTIVAEGELEANLARLAVSLQRSTDNVDARVVEDIARCGQLRRVIDLAADSDNSLKLRQLALILLSRRSIDETFEVAGFIPSNGERKNVGLEAIRALAVDPTDSEAQRLLLRIYASVRDPQRREMRDVATRRGVEVEWPALESNP
jgi:hypothetical protein